MCIRDRVRSIGGGGAEILGIHDGAGQLADYRVIETQTDHIGDGHRAAAAGGQLDEQLRAGLMAVSYTHRGRARPCWRARAAPCGAF